MEKTISDIELRGFALFKKGKVRNVFDLGDKLLIVATDRISAFDFILPSLIPYKGKVLTQISKFWFDFTSLVCPNHLISAETADFPAALKPYAETLDKTVDARQEDPRSSLSSASSAATWPGRDGRNTSPRGRSAVSRSPQASGNRTGWKSPSSRPRPRPRKGTTSTSPSRRCRSSWAATWPGR